MKPILYIDQQIDRAQKESIRLDKYISESKSLSKTRIRSIMTNLNYHLKKARNVFPSEENHETEEERNKIPDEFK